MFIYDSRAIVDICMVMLILKVIGTKNIFLSIAVPDILRENTATPIKTKRRTTISRTKPSIIISIR